MDRTRPADHRDDERRSQTDRHEINRYGDDFLIDKIQPDEIIEDFVNVGELVADEVWQIINESEHSLQEDYSVSEREVDPEQSEIERRENTKLRVLEWMRNLETDEREAQNIQQIDVLAMKHVKTGNPLFGWTATDLPLEKPPDNLNPAPSTVTSINIFVRGVEVELTHTKNLMIKKLREVRETGWKWIGRKLRLP